MISLAELHEKLAKATNVLEFYSSVEAACDMGDYDDMALVKIKKKHGDTTATISATTENYISTRRDDARKIVARLEKKIKLAEQPESCMDPKLYGLSPSLQANSSAETRDVAKQAFYTSVDDVKTVVADVSILRSLMIATQIQ